MSASQTRRLYAGDWSHFVRWCRAGQHTVLPASPATMTAYLQALASQVSPGTLGRRRSAVAAMHRQQGLPVPALDAATRAILRQSRPPTARSAAGPPVLARLAPDTLAGLRDRALLLLAAATDRGTRPAGQGPRVPRAFLLLLDAEHVTFTPGGAVLRLHTRTDAPPDRMISLARYPAPTPCPVRTLEDWLRASGTAFGPVFRKVDRWGNVEHARLGPGIWTRILRHHAG